MHDPIDSSMRDDNHRAIRRAIALFLSGTLFSRLTGLGRDLATAWAFGATPSVAALLVAFRLSHLLRRLLGEGVLQGAFVPAYERRRRDGAAPAMGLFLSLFGAMLLLLLPLSLGAGALLEGFLAWRPDLTEGNAEIIHLTALLMPGLPFICLYALCAALLQAHRRFFVAGAAPALLNIGWTAAVLWWRHGPPHAVMPLVALAIVASTALQWLATMPGVWRLTRSALPQLSWRDVVPCRMTLRQLKAPLLLGALGVAATQVNSAVDVLFARWVDLSGPAYLWYAIRIQQLPLALFGIAVANAVLPPLARAAAGDALGHFHDLCAMGLRDTLRFIMPVTAALLLFAPLAVDLLYSHGDFGAVDATLTTRCLLAYAMGLPPAACLLLLAPLSQARGDYRTPTLLSLAAIAVNMALNGWLVFVVGSGVASIALATAASSWAQLALYLLQWRGEAAMRGVGSAVATALRGDLLALAAATACRLALGPYGAGWLGLFCCGTVWLLGQALCYWKKPVWAAHRE